MSSDLIVAISGKSGCGNTTVSRTLAEKLGLRLVNYTFKTMAAERGMTFDELYQAAQNDDSYDRHLDRRQVELASRGGCVLGSRLAIWLMQQATLKVYLEAPLDVRAARIAERENLSLDVAKRETEQRDAQDHGRYLALYGIETDDLSPADLIVSNVGPLETVIGAIEAELASGR